MFGAFTLSCWIRQGTGIEIFPGSTASYLSGSLILMAANLYLYRGGSRGARYIDWFENQSERYQRRTLWIGYGMLALTLALFFYTILFLEWR
jgi:hypothetical protein